MTEQTVERTLVLLSLQRAMLGEVFPALRAVSVEWTASTVKFFAYVDGHLTSEDAESISCISAEVAADFWPGIDVDYEIIEADASISIRDSRTRIFQRRERISSGP